jgi:hypothetical protein
MGNWSPVERRFIMEKGKVRRHEPGGFALKGEDLNVD